MSAPLALGSFVPQNVARILVSNPEIPSAYEGIGICLMADLCGFTSLAEAYCEHVSGAEQLAALLEDNFSPLINAVERNGGEVIKFAGDALICAFPGGPFVRRAAPRELSDRRVMRRRSSDSQHHRELPTVMDQSSLHINSLGHDEQATATRNTHRLQNRLATPAQRALLCAQQILATGLKIKLGIGGGYLELAILGGSSHSEFLISGDALFACCMSESFASEGICVVCPLTWACIDIFATAVPADLIESMESDGSSEDTSHTPGSGFMRITNISDTLVQLTESEPLPELRELCASAPPETLQRILATIKTMVPAPARQVTDTADPRRQAEMRPVTIVFVDLETYDPENDSLLTLQRHFMDLSRLLKEHRGQCRQMCVDDKGCVFIACFGLPSDSHTSDIDHAIAFSMDLRVSLGKRGMSTRVGVATGRAFCGVVGSASRQEYMVVGDVANLAARLMAASSDYGGLLLAPATVSGVRGMDFDCHMGLLLKGKSGPQTVYSPQSNVRNQLNRRLQSRRPTVQLSLSTTESPHKQTRSFNSRERVVLARMDRLPEDARLLLKAASVWGVSFPEQVLPAILPRKSETEIQSTVMLLLQKSFIRRVRGQRTSELACFEDPLEFRNHMVFKAVEAITPDSLRQPAHSAIANWLQTQFPNDIDRWAARLAYHYESSRLDRSLAAPYIMHLIHEATTSGDIRTTTAEVQRLCSLELSIAQLDQVEEMIRRLDGDSYRVQAMLQMVEGKLDRLASQSQAGRRRHRSMMANSKGASPSRGLSMRQRLRSLAGLRLAEHSPNNKTRPMADVIAEMRSSGSFSPAVNDDIEESISTWHGAGSQGPQNPVPAAETPQAPNDQPKASAKVEPAEPVGSSKASTTEVAVSHGCGCIIQ